MSLFRCVCVKVCVICELLNGLQAISAHFVYKLPGARSDWAQEMSHTISARIILVNLPFVPNECLAVKGE